MGMGAISAGALGAFQSGPNPYLRTRMSYSVSDLMGIRSNACLIAS